MRRSITVVAAMIVAWVCTGAAWGWEDVEGSAAIAEAEAATARAAAACGERYRTVHTSPANHWSWGDERLHAPMMRYGGVFGEVVFSPLKRRSAGYRFEPGSPTEYRLVTPDGEERTISPSELGAMMRVKGAYVPAVAGFRTSAPFVGKTGARSSPLSDSSWAGQQQSAPTMRYEGVSGTTEQPTPADEERD